MKCTIYKGHRCPENTGISVVIDVIRAFTTAAYAFDSGADEITFVETKEEAFRLYSDDHSMLLMGEEEGLPIEGFHFQNSPAEVSRAALHGKRLIQRTSSGTQGIIGSRHLPHILAASFVVAEATVQRILAINPPLVTFLITGRHNGDEDAALADYLVERLNGRTPAKAPYQNRVRNSFAAKRLVEGSAAYSDGKTDIELALMTDRFPFAIEVVKRDGALVGKPYYEKGPLS